MLSNNNSSTLVTLAAGSALALSATYYYYVHRSLDSSSEIVVKNNEKEDDVEYITEDDIVKVFDALFLQMQNVISQLGQQIQQLQMMGQSIPPAQLQQIFKGEFERALSSHQSKIFEEHDMDEECVKEATFEFLADPVKYPNAKKAVERFQKLWENVTGESVTKTATPTSSAPATASSSSSDQRKKTELSKEELLKCASIYFDGLTKAMRDIVDRFRQEGKDMRDPMVASQLHMEFGSIANAKAEEELLKQVNTPLAVFRAGIEKFANDAEVSRTMVALQMKQQQDLMSLGIAGM